MVSKFTKTSRFQGFCMLYLYISILVSLSYIETSLVLIVPRPIMSEIKELLCVTDEEKRCVLSMYQKSEDDIKDYIKIIKDWVSKQQHLPQNQDERRLERLLIRNKFRVEQVKQKLENYYTLRTEDIDTFIPINNPRMKAVAKSGCFTAMPLLSKNMERIMYYETTPDPTDWRIEDLTTYASMMLELCVTYDYSIGDRLVVNLENVTIGHTLRINVAKLIKYVKIHQEAMSGRYLGIEFVKVTSLLEHALRLCKLIFPPKLYNKISVHNSLESLYEVVDKKSLPSELGGEAGSCRDLQEKWFKVMGDNADYLKELSETVADETLRIGPSRLQDGFGVEGSFKKLNID